MENAFGASFGDVRIHTDSEGAAIAQEESALAFAVGTHIAFAPGRYQPGSVEGDALLAHELTHVLQQRGATESASKDVSEVGDAAEKDADRGATNVVAQLHGNDKAPSAEKPGAQASSDLQLQRCIGSLNEGEGEMLREHRGFWNQDPTFEGDPFHVKLYQHRDKDVTTLDADFDYTGPGDSDGQGLHWIIHLERGKAIDPIVSTDQPDEWATLTVDAHGDGSNLTTFRRTTTFLDGWNPKSRKHTFNVKTQFDIGDAGSTRSTVIKSQDALPGTTANTPISPGDQNVEALRIDIAAITTKEWLDEILNTEVFGIDKTKPPWAGLKAKVDADAARYTSNATDAHDEAMRLTRLGQVITRTRPLLRALGAASKKEAYLPDIADESIGMVAGVRDKYAAAIAASWDGPATAELNAADVAFNALWFRISSLYLQNDRGVNKLISSAGSAAGDVKNLREGHRPLVIYRELETAIGVPGMTNAKPSESQQPPISEAQEKYREIRDAFLRGDVGSLSKVQKVVEDAQVLAGLAALLCATEIFYGFKREMDGIVGTIADKAPLTTNYTKVCNGYISKFEAIASNAETELKAGKTIDDVGKEAVSQFQGICDDKFQADIKDIQGRIKNVKILEALSKVLAIIGVAALTGGAAGAAIGGALEGAGASAAVIATGEFAAEVVTFTLVSRLGNEAVFGKNDTGLGEDLITNALMFGFLKAAMAGYGRVFKAYAQTHKTAVAVGGAMTGMLGLQIFAEIHHKLKTGKMMDWDERAVGIFQNAVMMVALALGGYLAKPKAERIRVKMLQFAAKNVPGALEKIEAKLAGLKTEIDGLKAGGGKKDMDRLADLLQKIEKLWNEQISVLADAAKAEKEKKAEATKEFQEQVAQMVNEIAKLDLQLSQAGVEIDLGSAKSGNFYRPLSPGYVAFKEAGLEVLKDFYKENGGTFSEVKGKEGLYVGKDASGEIFFVKDDVANSFFDRPTVKPPTEAEAKANRLAAKKAKLQNKQRADQLRKLIGPHIQDGHVVYKFGRVVNGTGLAAAMDANTLPGAARGDVVPPLDALPDTLGLGTGAETFAKLGDTPIGQAAPELSGGGGWAHGASPADMTANHGDYASAQTIADAVALTQLRSGVPILDGSIKEISVTPDGTWKVPDAKVRIKATLADGTEVFIYADATDIATGLGPPRELERGQINADRAKEARFKSTLTGDGRLVYGDSVGVQKGGTKVLVSGGSATGAWNAKVARSLGALVDWIARDSASKAPPKSEHAARKYEQIQDQLNAGEITPAEAEKQMADLRAFDPAALPRNVQAADSAMNDAGITRGVKEIASMTPTEEIPGEKPGHVEVTFTDGTSGVYDQVVVSHGTNLGAKGAMPGALTLAKGIEMRPIVVDGQVVALESVKPPGAVRVVGAAMWSRAWIDGGFISETEFVNGMPARDVYSNALQNQALSAPRDSPGNMLIHNTGNQVPTANTVLGGGEVDR